HSIVAWRCGGGSVDNAKPEERWLATLSGRRCGGEGRSGRSVNDQAVLKGYRSFQQRLSEISRTKLFRSNLNGRTGEIKTTILSSNFTYDSNNHSDLPSAGICRNSKAKTTVGRKQLGRDNSQGDEHRRKSWSADHTCYCRNVSQPG